MKWQSGLADPQRLSSRALVTTLLVVVSCQWFAQASFAGTREQARRIHDRLAGVPPSETVLNTMEQAIIDNPGNVGRVNAAFMAMDNPAFYSVTLKNIAAPWTNRDQDIFVPLNDYVATYIGLVRDGDDVDPSRDFRQILHGDVIYVGTAATGVAGYSNSDNNHYQQLEDNNVDLSQTANLEKRVQSVETDLVSTATAGVMTTRAAARAFFIDGTNRAMLRYTLLNHLCYDLEQLKDTTRPADRIRQDISRTPGGDSRLFMNNCVGCHSGMDPLAQAFAYYQYDYPANSPDAGSLSFTDGVVQPKYFINATTFPLGFVTPDNSWDNFWRKGVNEKLLGWDATLPANGSGQGAKSMGQELAHSDAFARCHVLHAFEASCLREPSNQTDVDEVARIQTVFETNNYNLKRVFAETASYCAGS